MTEFIDYLSEKYQPDSVDEINRRLLELESLFEISQLLNASLELSQVLNNVLLIPMGRLLISRGAIVLRFKDRYQTLMSKGIPRECTETEFKLVSAPGTLFFVDDPPADAGDELIAFARKAGLKIGLPFISNDALLGLVFFGPKLSGASFQAEETNFLNSLASLSATTIDNALRLEEIRDVNKQLDHKVHELKTLFDIGQGLSSTLDFEQILRLLVYALMGQMLITRYGVFLCDEKRWSLHEVKGMEKSLIDLVKRCAEVENFTGAARLASQCKDSNLVTAFQANRVEVIIPMRHQNSLNGMILLGGKSSAEAYSETDLEFLTTLVGQAVISLENARLFEEALEKQRLEEELNVARNIQKGLLPRQIAAPPGYEIFGMNNSSKQVGGDYYDVIPIDESRIALAIADVSGKGVPASLLMANMQAALRVMMTPDVNLGDAVGKLNTLIHANTSPDKFITFFIGILDYRKHSFHYVNAGHNNPVTTGGGEELEMLDVGGIILGILPQYTYQTGTITIEKGQTVLTYTDGVNEAINPHEEEFGEERLYALIREHIELSVENLVEKILQEIDAFSEGEPQADDVTMLAFRHLG